MSRSRLLTIAVIAALLSGCGTINTVFHEDATARRNLKKWETYCSSIPRVYSGFSYNMCMLNGPSGEGSSPGLTINHIPLPILDIIPSGIFDTLLVPYTIYQQGAHGDIELKR